MKKEKCEAVMDEFLMKDKNEFLPLSVILHVIHCKECRTMIRRMTLAEKSASKSLSESIPADNSTLNAVMQKISAMELSSGRNAKPVSFAGWIIAGAARRQKRNSRMRHQQKRKLSYFQAFLCHSSFRKWIRY